MTTPPHDDDPTEVIDRAERMRTDADDVTVRARRREGVPVASRRSASEPPFPSGRRIAREAEPEGLRAPADVRDVPSHSERAPSPRYAPQTPADGTALAKAVRARARLRLIRLGVAVLVLVVVAVVLLAVLL